MTKAKKPPEVDEVGVLFPEEQVGPYTMRPWSLEQFMSLTGAIVKMMEGFIALGLTEDNAEEFLQRDFAMLAPAIAPIAEKVIAVTLRLSPAEVANISIGLKSALVIRILILDKENQDQIKNFLAGFFGSGKKNPAKSPAEKNTH